MITVGQLRRALDGLDDSLPVLLDGGPDHSLHTTHFAGVATVGKFDKRRTRDGASYSEWHGESHASPGEEPVQAMVIG